MLYFFFLGGGGREGEGCWATCNFPLATTLHSYHLRVVHLLILDNNCEADFFLFSAVVLLGAVRGMLEATWHETSYRKS